MAGIKLLFSLVPESVLLPAIGTLPRNSVAGHPPEVFMHASLADTESTATLPAKGENTTTAMAVKYLCLSTFSPTTP